MNVGGYDGTEASPGYAALQVNSNRLPIIASSINDHLAAAEQATKRGLSLRLPHPDAAIGFEPREPSAVIDKTFRLDQQRTGSDLTYSCSVTRSRF
jgi:hypothetical protein